MHRRVLTTLRGNHTTISQCAIKQFKILLPEQRLCRSLRIAGVRNDDVEFVLPVLEVGEAVADVDFYGGVLEADAHAGEVFLGEADHGFVDVDKCGRFDCFVLYDFAEDTAVAAADDEDLLGVGVRVHGEVRDHLLVAVELQISLGFLTEHICLIYCVDGRFLMDRMGEP